MFWTKTEFLSNEAKQHIIMNSHGDVTTLIDIPETPSNMGLIVVLQNLLKDVTKGYVALIGICCLTL